jgi:hypothetical protein
MTHADNTPWKEILDNNAGDIPKRTKIDDTLIKKYFDSYNK